MGAFTVSDKKRRHSPVCEAYTKAIKDNTPGDNLLALGELEFYLGQSPERTGSREAQSTVAFVLSQLESAS
jgi:hypothetical protein